MSDDFQDSYVQIHFDYLSTNDLCNDAQQRQEVIQAQLQNLQGTQATSFTSEKLANDIDNTYYTTKSVYNHISQNCKTRLIPFSYLDNMKNHNEQVKSELLKKSQEHVIIVEERSKINCSNNTSRFITQCEISRTKKHASFVFKL